MEKAWNDIHMNGGNPLKQGGCEKVVDDLIHHGEEILNDYKEKKPYPLGDKGVKNVKKVLKESIEFLIVKHGVAKPEQEWPNWVERVTPMFDKIIRETLDVICRDGKSYDQFWSLVAKELDTEFSKER